MERFNSIERGNEMKKYIKPSVIGVNNKYSILPLAAVAAIGTGLTAAGAAAAFAGGVAIGLAAATGDDRKNIFIEALPKCI